MAEKGIKRAAEDIADCDVTVEEKRPNLSAEDRTMTEASISLDQDQFSCLVCLDLLKDPVTIPCGHSFCMVCINDCWDENDQRRIYSCPQCRETFTPRPVLHRNNMLAEVVEKLKKTELQAAGPEDVECDFCTGRKLKAIKSCLMCQTSFCETHLKPHYEVPGLKKHKLIKASSHLQEKICSQHGKVIKIYCRTDQNCICYLCMLHEHKGHDTVPAGEEISKKQSELKEEQRQFEQRIQEKEKKVQELKQAEDTLKCSARAAVKDSRQTFTELIYSIKKRCCEVRELIRDQEKAELSRAKGFLDKLEQEIADLKRRDTELEQLSHTEDHIHFLQRFQSLCVSSGSEESPMISVNQHLTFDGVTKSLSDLKERLEKLCTEEFNKIPPQGKWSCPAVKNKDGILYLLSDGNVSCNSSTEGSNGGAEEIPAQNPEEKKVQEIKQAVDTLKRFAQAAVNNNRRIFTELIRSIKQRRCEVRDLIRAQEEAELSRAERLLEQLEQEIADLKRRDTELEQFSQTDDDIHFLQSFQSLCVSSGSEDSPSIPVHQHPSFDGVKKSTSDLKERLKEFCKEEFNKILQHAAVVQILPSEPETREDFLKYFCQLSLDPNTTHRRLSLSERNKVVTRSEKVHLYSDHPEIFDYLPQVLSKKSVCGRCYWEVELSNGSYVFISVSYKDISRKGHGKDCMFGFNNQSWRLQCSSTLSFWHNNIKNEIPGPPSSRIGVYVDHSAGTLSFYRVTNTMTLIHTVHTTFIQPLYGGLWVGWDSTVRFGLKEEQRKWQQRIQEKEKKKVQELKQAVDTLKYSVQAAVEDSEENFSALIHSIQKKRCEGGVEKMEAASISIGQDQLSCPVCLDLLKDPVTISCGHSFCMLCINACWDQDDQTGIYSCPHCRETFTSRPVVRRDNMLAVVVEKMKNIELQAASPALCYAGPGDVECNFCTGRKLKAIKSCLMCLASFCETHLKPHYEVPGLKKHMLIKASSHLQKKICCQHDEVTKIYCRTDQNCICYLCMIYEHKGHDTVPAVAERNEKQIDLKKVQRKFQQRIQEKEKKVQELKQAVDTLKCSAQAAVEDIERIFTELIHSIEKKCCEVKELIRDQEKIELSQAKGLLDQLEQEIADLKRRNTELEQLSHTEDHVHFLQRFQSLCVYSGSEESPVISVNQHLSFDGVTKPLSDLKDRFCREEFNKISPHAAAVQIILSSEPKTREDFLK
ncbi:hypothetical protein P4O66_019057, partial [Electrophorus voltai]